MTRVLVVATSRKTRGGITSVIKAHETGEQWQKYHCHWVQTHRDGPAWRKILYLLCGLLDYLIRLPFYDIIHFHIANYGSCKRKNLFICSAKLFHKKIIVHLHSSGNESFLSEKYHDIFKYSLNSAHKIILLSNTWREHIEKNYNIPTERIEVLYNPCPIVNPSRPDEREQYILFAGTITHLKGYADLIKAFSKVSSKYPTWRLKFAGNGEIDRGKELAQNLGVDDKLDFLGWTNKQEKDNAFRHASIFCLPSYTEGFPMAVLDAWAYGLPVITTPVGGIPDVAQDGKNMLLFTPGDIDKLAEQLERMISDKELRDQISVASADFEANKFNIKTINKQVGDLYLELSK